MFCYVATSASQFVPKYLSQAKQRIKELSKELDQIPPTLTTDIELWGAYRKRVSQVIELLRGMLAMRGDKAVCGNDKTMDIIPHVDVMYEDYAKEILKVRLIMTFCFSVETFIKLFKLDASRKIVQANIYVE